MKISKLICVQKSDSKGGTYFGATGCGKSYTMLFLLVYADEEHLYFPTILLIADRTDLDDQLSKQFISSKNYIGDEGMVVLTPMASQELQGRIGVYDYHSKVYRDLSLLTDRSNVIAFSDEAHRSQINLDQKSSYNRNRCRHAYGLQNNTTLFKRNLCWIYKDSK